MSFQNSEKCNKCGICNLNSREYSILRKESISPRNLVQLFLTGKINEVFYSLSSDDYYKKCPVGVKMDLPAIRAKLISLGIETEANKKMRANMIKYGNPYGDQLKTKEIRQLYT